MVDLRGLMYSCLTQHEVVSYLLQRKLISPECIVHGDLAVVNASRRNHNFKIISEHGPSYLLKQGVDPGRIATVSREAAMYQLLRSEIGNGGFHQYLPYFYGYDTEQHILVLEFLRDTQDLGEHYARRGPFSTTLAAAMGNALGTLHRLTQMKEKGNKYFQGFSRDLPWVLFLHRPDLGLLRDISSANIQVIKVIQQFPEFCELLDSLRQEWKTEALIHFDIKWDNCIISTLSTARWKSRLKIVDWELAGVGDPRWDIGSVFSEYLSSWLLSIHITKETSPDQFSDLAHWPLNRMQPAIRSFWQSYVKRMELSTGSSDDWLLCAVRFGAARLVQTAFEQMQLNMHLTENIIYFLQVSLNILRRPQDAIVHLLGIHLHGMRML